MQRRSGSATYQQWYIESRLFQFNGNMYHFIQRRSDKATQPNHVYLFLYGPLHNRFSGNHYSQVNYLISVASHYYGNNIFPNVVHITFHRSKQHLAGRGSPFLLFRFNDRLKNSHRFLHSTCRFHHLRKKHLTRTEQIANMVHSGHQRTFNDIHSFRINFQSFSEVFFQIISDAFCQSILQTFLYGIFTPGKLRTEA